MRRFFFDGFGRLLNAFVQLGGCLVFRDVQRGDDFLLALGRGRELFLVLEGLVELFGQVFALPVELLEVGFALAEAFVEAAEGVFKR